MKILITYSSKTNNTKKIAEKLKEYLPQATLLKMSEVTSLKEYDLIYVGGWIDKGFYNEEADSFIKKIKNKKVSFFFTLGAYPNSVHAYDCLNNIKNALIKNNIVLSHFHAQGAIDPKLMNWMKTLPQAHGHGVDKSREMRWADAANHPNEEDYRSLYAYVNYTQKRIEDINNEI